MENLTFDQLPLSEELQSAVKDMGFTQASPIQFEAIPYILEGKDIIGQAQTGTGKTAAFAIPAIENVDTSCNDVQVLVLCPTRELALQVSQEFKKLAKYKDKFYVAAIYGGEPIEKQFGQLKRGVQVVVGTPGRVIDHLNRKTLRIDALKMIILDEADEMLNMGFKEDIERVLREVPTTRQTVFFSATMPKPILELTKKYQNNPEYVTIEGKNLTSKHIEQSYFAVRSEHKIALMQRLIEFNQFKSMLVFCNTKRKTDEVADTLNSLGYQSDAIHGDLSQSQRNNVMGKFRKGRSSVLVATDVAARGIDVDDVEAVFNYDIPLDPEYYVHRIGRTGRAGKNGIAYTFVMGREMSRLKDIERYAKLRIEKGKMPSEKEVQQKREEIFLEKISTEITPENTQKFADLLNKLEEREFDMRDIAAALLNMSEDLKQDIAEIEMSTRGARTSERGQRDRDGKRPRQKKGEFKARLNVPTTRLFINLGKNQRVSKGDILGAIAGETGLSGNNIGMIDVYDKFSFVDVPEKDANMVLQVMNQIKIKGKKANFEIAK
ncbi:MAG: DEAD/DEAH box helicase [Bernardetiaceae bacterium]|nr:DEAD/DEAH box helicase [Bernardetiaceae bacterium]